MILIAHLMPGISFLMPWYIVFSRLRLMDSYVALILSHILISLPIVVYNFMSYAEVDWGGVMAAAVAIMALAIILTMIFQKYVTMGLTMGAVKEAESESGVILWQELNTK